MNKHNLMKKMASIATELDQAGFEKEANKIDLMMLKMAEFDASRYKNPNVENEFDTEEEAEDFYARFPEIREKSHHPGSLDYGPDDWTISRTPEGRHKFHLRYPSDVNIDSNKTFTDKLRPEDLIPTEKSLERFERIKRQRLEDRERRFK